MTAESTGAASSEAAAQRVHHTAREDFAGDDGTDPSQGVQHGAQDAEVTRVRSLTGFWRWMLVASAAVTIFLCVNQQFTLRFFVGFTPLNTEYYYGLLLVTLPLVFIIFPGREAERLDRVPWRDVALFLLTIGACIYLMLNIRRAAALGWEFGGAPDAVVWTGYLLWALLMEGLRRTGGWGLMLSILPFTLYPVFADSAWLGPLRGHESSFAEASAYHMLSSESLLGIPIQALAETVIGFLVFGTTLMLTGAGRFFINLAFALCGTFRGGAAKVCVFSSALLGMMSGSIVSNVLTTGAMTIPVMKRTGFRPSYAGAIEACASTGAVLAPPIMGATAFIIAQFLNVSYAEVAMAAAIPAFLYYLGLFIQVDAYAARHGLVGLPRADLPKLGTTLREGWYFVLVIALLVFMLLVMKRESHAPFYATVLLIVLNQLFNRDRWTLQSVLRFLELNGRTFIELAGILAGCGLLIGAFSMTGVISSLAGDLLRAAGGNVVTLLMMTAITSLILGLGLTTTACYIFLAVLIGPALEQAGLNQMAVHMFIFYWGMLSAITPPVAIASFAAAGIAGAPAMKTGWESMRVGSLIYFLPFFFVFDPALVLQGSMLRTALLIVLIALGAFFLCGGIQGYQLGAGDLRRTGRLEWPLRLVLIVGGILLGVPGSEAHGWSDLQLNGLAMALLLPAVLYIRWCNQAAEGGGGADAGGGTNSGAGTVANLENFVK